LAAEILGKRPDLVGMQEVTLVRTEPSKVELEAAAVTPRGP
jgi:hypothetical protein